MPALQPVRGTHDILPEEILRHRHVEEVARATSALYGFAEIETPIFEFTEVFARTLGDTSDVVTKEMYTFEDRGGERLTLRPENTAGVARAFISGGLSQRLPLKLFYRGPMFRYERPQKGRLREFHQVGVELFGVADPIADVEVIALGDQFLETLGLKHRVRCELNTLGDMESRRAYRERLVAYLRDFRDRLSEDSRERLERNPLRILDSKDERDRAIVAGAPAMDEAMTDDARRFFDALRDGLERAGVAYVPNPRLVRGLDYYCHTVFEFITTDLGAQGTVLAGGRYDGLVEQMGGPATPGVGWAAGVERLAMLVETAPEPTRPVAVIPFSAAGAAKGLEITQMLRRAGIAADMGYSGNLQKRMKRADKLGARATVLLGEDELSRGAVSVRDMATGTQEEVPIVGLVDRLAAFG